ncbi:MAG: hypothetical protein QXO20_05420 [Candidatus Bathyarchaeia archaeon]
MLSFYELISIYAILTFVLTFILLRYSSIVCLERTAERNKGNFILILLLPAVILPFILNISNYYGSFVNPDSYAHILHVELMITEGSIPNWAINEYYQPFPVFSLIISTISLVTFLQPLQAYMLFHIFFVFLLSLSFLSFSKIIGRNIDRFTVLIAAMLLMGNTYVYGYFDTFVPSVIQALAIWMLMLLKTKQLKVPFIIFLIGFGLIHFFVIPTFLLISSVIAFLNILNLRLCYRQNKRALKLSASVILPLVFWLTYLFQSYAVYSLYSIKSSFLSYLTVVLKEYEISLSGGFSRPLAAINAIGTALVIGVSSAWIVFLLNMLVKRKKLNKDDIVTGGTALACMLLLPSALFFLIKPATTIAAGWARYTLFTCLFFNGCISALVLKRIIELLSVSESCRRPLLKFSLGLLLFLLFLAPIGGLTDPFTFKTTDNSLLLNSNQRTALDMMAKFLLRYFTWDKIELVGETSAIIYLKNSILYLNNSLQVRILRTGMKGTPYYMDITFEDTLNRGKYLHGFIIISEHELSNAPSLNFIYSGSVYKVSQCVK